MSKSKLTKQTLIVLYGLPGSGKSFFARQAGETLGIPVVSADRIRYELFETPTYSREEQDLISNLVSLISDGFLDQGLSVIVDMSHNRVLERKALREYTKKRGIVYLLVWVQTDADTCISRVKTRDGRKSDDKYSADMNPEIFTFVEGQMQQPSGEDALVVSGKHLYDSQRSVLLRKLREMQVLQDEAMSHIAKPEMVNLVSAAQMKAGRVDDSRRNVSIS